ncbi:ribonuclease BN/unknown domain fusion protein [Limihaloglobus sulfuriphilus]|uniref:YihY family inner membrane protein n=2 Tax=Limihaloglobus sulfuriphilus TaxID=1851148 RepID=A0A1Q2MHK7_9BACT|nr:ribonuclease BN/unknown domain fusion protein [Limihaloglobus sulfuriphilus]
MALPGVDMSDKKNRFRFLPKKLEDWLYDSTGEIGRLGGMLIYQFKLWPLCVKLLRRNRSNQQAAALAYHTIFGIIPLVIIMFVIFQSFPSYEKIGDQLRNDIYENLNLDQLTYPDPKNPEQELQVTEYLDGVIERFFESSKQGTATIVSIILVFWAVMKLLTTIEKTFNNIWNVAYGRTFIQRVISFWTPLTLGPLLIGGAVYLKTSPYVTRIFGGAGSEHLQPLLPFILTVMALFFLYIAMPNTRVKALPALWSAIIAALIWFLLKHVFNIYMEKFIPYSKLYGAMGLIPLTVFYIYLTWMIVIFGVQLSYTIQNLKKIDFEEMKSAMERESALLANDMLILRIMGFLAFRFVNGDGPTRYSLISRVFNLPGTFVQAVMKQLAGEGLVVYATDPDEGFMLQRTPEKITVNQVLDAFALEKVGLREPYKSSAIEDLVRKSRKNAENVTVRDVCDSIKQFEATAAKIEQQAELQDEIEEQINQDKPENTLNDKDSQ